MTQAPISVWNEVRFTSDGISISLFSESPDGGAILEDEMWFTYDELQDMAPSEPKSLRLTEETGDALVENLAERGSQQFGELDGQESVQSDTQQFDECNENDIFYDVPNLGDVVRDTNPPEWSDDALLEIVSIPFERADEYVVNEEPSYCQTVYDVNSCQPDEPVVEAKYLDEYGQPSGKTYAFPLSRIEDV